MGKEIKRTNVATNLRLYRKKMNITQEEIAERLGIKRTTYARYETTTKVPISILKKLSDILNVSTDSIVSEPVDYVQINNIKNPGKNIKVANSSQYITDIDDVSTTHNAFADEYTITVNDVELEIINKFRELSKDEQKHFIELLK